MTPRPPRLMRWVLENLLPADARHDVVGDLDEVWRARRTTTGSIRTAAWYLGQMVGFIVRFNIERIREALSLRGLSVGLDLRLGVRMLWKYPALTAVGGLAIMVATALGVGASEFVRDMIAPRLPLDEGDRIVRMHFVDAENGAGTAASLFDLEHWRETVSSLENLGAYRVLEQGFSTDGGKTGTVSLARITASGFDLTRVPPLMGRTLLATDEHPEAESVVVLGWDTWHRLLDGDPNPIGRTVRVGGSPTTVVGVMPEGFAFPEIQDAWVALRQDIPGNAPATSPRGQLFARLAPGATLQSAQAELEIVSVGISQAHPDVYERLTPRVQSFAARSSSGMLALALAVVGLLFAFLLVVACANVATLVFARTVTREGEIAVRASLGATRRRIAMQLFAEALILVGGATLAGVLLARFALGRISRLFFEIQQVPRPPFWWDDGLSATTLAYAGVLAFLAALVIGIVPALKATRGDLQPRLGRLSHGTGGGLRFGGVWTAVIVLQVALSVAFLPLAVSQAGVAFQDPEQSEFPAELVLTAQLGRDPQVPPRTPEDEADFLQESARMFERIRERLNAEPGIEAAALASGLSAMNHLMTNVEFVADGSEAPISGTARVLLVDPSYLPIVDAPVVAGRSFGPGDLDVESGTVMVNEAFVERILNGRNPVGAILRFPERAPGSDAAIVQVPAAGTSVLVVGVVRNPGVDRYGPGTHPAIYAPMGLAPSSPRHVGLVGMPQAPSAQLFLRLRREGGMSPARLYAVLAEVDPSLRMSELGSLAQAWRPAHLGARLGGWIFLGVAGIVLTLSVAGIYALMSFTVTRRTREIAIRVAMGATRGQIVWRIFRRATIQLAVGVALGSLVAVPVLLDSVDGERGPETLVLVASLLLGAGLVSCVLPIRRAMSIEPAAAIKTD